MTSPRAACSECRTLIGGYVLDALDATEADAVRRHLADCPDCAAEHARLAGIPALLALAGSNESAVEAVAERPPAALEEAVLDRFAQEHRADRDRDRDRDREAATAPAPTHARGASGPLRRAAAYLRRPLPAAAAGALVAAAVAAAVIVLPGGRESGEHHGEVYRASLDGSAAAPGARAHARLETAPSGTQVLLRVRGLRGDPGDRYELWCIGDDGTKISAGTFRVDARGRAETRLTSAAVPGEYHRMSIERKTPGPRGGVRVMAGSIHY